MSNELEDCNPQIEECPVPAERAIVEGSFNSTLVLGVIALIQAILPTILISTTFSSLSASVYKYAGYVWWVGNGFIYGFLSILWPLTYLQIQVIESFYLTYFLNAGIYVAGGLTVIIGAMFLYAALSGSSAAYTYFFMYIILNPALVYLSYLFYETAHAYYIPQVRVIEKVPVIEEEPEEEPEEEEEEEKEELPEEEPEDDNSPFVDFLLVTI